MYVSVPTTKITHRKTREGLNLVLGRPEEMVGAFDARMSLTKH